MNYLSSLYSRLYNYIYTPAPTVRIVDAEPLARIVDVELTFKPIDPLILKLVKRDEPITFTRARCIYPCNCVACEPPVLCSRCNSTVFEEEAIAEL